MADNETTTQDAPVTPAETAEQAEVMAAEHEDQAAQVSSDTDAESNDDAQGEANTVDVDEAIAAPTSTIPQFRAGDTLRLGVRIVEGEKTRIQYFEGIVLSVKGAGVSRSFTIRKIGAGGVAVERIFPLNSPTLATIEIRRRGIVRRSKVYFLRDIVGSTANVIRERKIARDPSTKVAKAKKQKPVVDAAAKAEKAKTDKLTRAQRRALKNQD
jgi:large subunit ribosomal protein L19